MTRAVGRAGSVAVAAVVAIAAVAGPAAAHQTAVKYLDLAVDGADIAIDLRAQPPDMTRPLGLPDDAIPTVAQALAGASKITPFVATWMVIESGGAVCTPTAPTVAPAAADPRFLSFHWTAHCSAPVDELVLDLDGFFGLDRTHEMLLHLTAPDADPYDTSIAIGDSPLSMRLRGDIPASAIGWIWLGVTTFYRGLGQLAFVLALVLVVVIERRRAPIATATGRATAAGWDTRAPRTAIRATAIVIAAFALGSTLGAAAAVIGGLALPGRFLAVMGGAAIAYTAIENIVDPAVRWRHVPTFAFGAITGLGSAAALAALLPSTDDVAALVELDAGVVLGQLSLAAAAVTVLALVSRRLGADRYRRRLLPALSGAIAIAGVVGVAGALGL